MTKYKLALLGFGNVGQAFAQLLLDKQEELKTRYNIEYSVSGIFTNRHGSAIDPDGLDIEAAVALGKAHANLNALSTIDSVKDSMDFIRGVKAEILFENSPVNYETGQPALDHIKLALEEGMHAITANKGPVVHGYHELTQLANSRNRKFYFESAVMDGAPIFSLFRSALPGARLLSFTGILNSTTNLILTRMEDDETFEQALSYTQSAGLAETDPSGDIDGWDASVKVAALATVLMDIPIKPVDVERQGIRGITSDDIRAAKAAGERWKLVCTCRREGSGLKTRVAPERVPIKSPLYNVMGSSSVVSFEMDVLSNLTIVENDPGPETTAYGLLADFINAVR
ncbi:MAG: homoserine dehydrogenase [Anaerolineales bacterium]|nr:homoserine dehydrogenase [Anaerolineales bacterium]